MKIHKANNINIIKASGQTAFYNEDKVKRSLMHAGASEEITQEILSEIGSQLYPGITTKEIYKIAYRMLKNQSGYLAARYNLKKAIMELGPSGFPFEKYTGEIFSHEGYTISTGKILPGKCVNHEIDVIAFGEEKRLIIECKYHSQQGIFCDVKVPLYIHSRFNDVVAKLAQGSSSYQGWIVTNTRFSDDAIRYSTCAGLHLLSWDFPSGQSLKAKIDRLGLYPITCLTLLTVSEKQFLLEKNKVLCLEIQAKPELLAQAGLSATRMSRAMEEVERLCTPVKSAHVLSH